ncbi:MAG: galactokinase [Lachnospiraceae bacterium]|nr:galactokinase [Lachnospiraceae bacterium]
MMKLPDLQTLQQIYGETEHSLARYQSLAENYRRYFASGAGPAAGAWKTGLTGSDTSKTGAAGEDAGKAPECEMEFFTAPGRTEIVGNHTDHNGGRILAGSISLDTIGAAYPNGTDVITIVSEGYRDKVIVDLTKLDKVPKNKGTYSLVAGMAMAARKMGFSVSGFNAYVSTEVISAAGVSSSASFEMLICAIMNYFFNDGRMQYIDYARIGQYAENHFWDKASGLMDQMACAVGGTILLDFSKIAALPQSAVIRDEDICKRVEFSFSELGYDLVIVNTGKGHADLSDEYSSVPYEMKEAADAVGAKLLCETDEETVLHNLSAIDNDRAILRALHFFEENKRVDAAYQASLDRDEAALLKAIDESGRSSWEWLQNCYSIRNYKEQKVTLTLALTRLFLNRTGRGVCRVHGGGFAGVIACVLPQEETADYVDYIAQYVGKENVYPMNIRTFGAGHVESRAN